MDTYILQKDWIMPHTSMEHSTIIKAGTELTADGPNRMYKLPQAYSFNYKVVENTPEWFKKKDQEQPKGSQWNPTEKIWQPRGQNKLMPNHFFDQKPLNESFLDIGKEIQNNPDFDEYSKPHISKQPIETLAGVANQPRFSIREQHIWIKERVLLLHQAMERSGFHNCEEWIKEWNEHVNWLMNAKKPRV